MLLIKFNISQVYRKCNHKIRQNQLHVPPQRQFFYGIRPTLRMLTADVPKKILLTIQPKKD